MSLQINRSGSGTKAAPLMLERFWQWPLALWAGSWGTCVELMWPRSAPAPSHPPSREHDQLIVPEPIEATGEHSLFA